MDGFISWSHTRIHKKEETKRLNNLPSNFAESFYRDSFDGIDFSHETDFQQKIVKNTPIEDVKSYFLGTSEFGNEIEGDINLYVTSNRLNEASFRQKLDSVSKNITKIETQLSYYLKIQNILHKTR